MSFPPTKPSAPSTLSIEDGHGEELLAPNQEETSQVVIATDAQGNSLTLFEEYAQRRKRRISPVELALNFACAAASLAFAALIYLNTH